MKKDDIVIIKGGKDEWRVMKSKHSYQRTYCLHLGSLSGAALYTPDLDYAKSDQPHEESSPDATLLKNPVSEK